MEFCGQLSYIVGSSKCASLGSPYVVVDAAFPIEAGVASHYIAHRVGLELLAAANEACRVRDVPKEDRTHISAEESDIAANALTEVPIDWIWQCSFEFVSVYRYVFASKFAQSEYCRRADQ